MLPLNLNNTNAANLKEKLGMLTWSHPLCKEKTELIFQVSRQRCSLNSWIFSALSVTSFAQTITKIGKVRRYMSSHKYKQFSRGCIMHLLLVATVYRTTCPPSTRWTLQMELILIWPMWLFAEAHFGKTILRCICSWVSST